jgi:hypothetical protein
MSQLNITTIKNKRGDFGPTLVGLSTVTGNLNVTGSITGDGSGLTGIANTANIKSDTITVTGVVTATSFVGDVTGDVTGTASNASGATGDFSIADKIIHTGDTDTAIRFPADNTVTVETAGSERVRVDSTGVLQVKGDGGNNNKIYGYDGSDLAWIVGNNNSDDTEVNNFRSGNLLLKVSGSEKVRITDSGNVSIQNDSGKFTAGASDDLQIYHNGSNSYIDDGSGTGALIFKSNTYSFRNAADNEQVASFNENGSIDLYYDNSKKFETTSTGVTVTGDVNSTSDINLKKDIEVVTSATEMLNQLRGVKFTWKENGEPSLGVIAQEVENILPELVRGEEGDKSVNYSGLIAVLIESVKELSARVEELENR